MIAGMHPTTTGVATLAPPHVDVLHTIRIPRLRRDSHYLHRLVASLTDGYDRPLWALPAPETLIVRAPHLVEAALPDRARVSTSTSLIPDAGACVEWALVANPTRATGPRGDDGRLIGRSKRQPLPDDQTVDWVARKLTGPLVEVTVAACERTRALTGHNPRTGRTITHTRHMATGTAVVEDQGAFAELLRAGVGPGKAFGCGLLIVKEVA